MPRQKTRKNRRRSTLKLNRKRKQRGGGTTEPTFHILISTAGRPALKRMLDSLKGELRKGDAITIVFNGKSAMPKSGFMNDWLSGFQCVVNTIVHDPPLGFWGLAIRNEYQGKLSPETTFVMHADDDDRYKEGAFTLLRSKCKNPECLYIARMKGTKETDVPIPRSDVVEVNNISVQNGIIPFSMRDASKWVLEPGGDGKYYMDLVTKVKCVEHIYDVIYEYMRDQGDVNATA